MNNRKIIDHPTKQWKVGDIRNGYPVLSAENRKTILLLSDDL